MKEKTSLLANFHTLLFKLSIIFLICFLFFIRNVTRVGSKTSTVYANAHNSTSNRDNDILRKTDAYIINTYYYPTSESFGENAVGMILLMNRYTQTNITNYKMKLVATDSTNRSIEVVPKLLLESACNCTFVNIVAIANSLSELTKLEIFDGNTKLQVPFRVGRTTSPAPVIICLSPQFVAEQWQIFVAHAHIARKYGGHLHLYITSMIDSFFKLIEVYEKLGYVTIDYWMRIKFHKSTAPFIEPNVNSELRNQAGAHTDCLYQYKEAASFIAFFDLDDIFIPRGFNSYFDEFSAVHALHPGKITFQYRKRDTLVFNKARIEDVSFEEMFGHTWFVKKESYGKVIANPRKLHSMSVHVSFNVPENNHYLVRNINHLVHLQKPIEPDGTDPVPYKLSEYAMIESMQLNISTLKPIQQDFERFLRLEEVKGVTGNLQVGTYYFKIIYRCYYETFYKNASSAQCPNGEGCLIPQRSDLNCVHAEADCLSGPEMYPITYHYHTNSRWSETVGCHA